MAHEPSSFAIPPNRSTTIWLVKLGCLEPPSIGSRLLNMTAFEWEVYHGW